MVDAGVFRSFKGSVKIEIDSGKPTQASWLITETGNLEPNPTGEASCTVKFSTATFHAMLSKQVSPQVALFKGDLSIKGDMGLALKLAKFL
ncbi:MAG: SCP2 sterol-binding domain-containing protein [archaeon]|nr:SCP2 sterol-binding domain-containing protein [archaeon]